jgi:hypothetical protein
VTSPGWRALRFLASSPSSLSRPQWRRWGTRLLIGWFLVWSSYVALTVPFWGGLGGDALIYYRAASAWIAGGNPWLASVTAVGGGTTFHFYGLPPTVVFLAPVTLIPEPWVPAIGIVIEAIAAAYVVRKLQLPMWWLVFPPIVSGVLSGNPSIVLLATLLASSPVIQATAPILKIYAALPLLGSGRWRAIGLSIAATALTVLLAPGLWQQFLDGSTAREAQLMGESSGGFSAFQFGVFATALTAIAIVVLASIDRPTAGWLAPIAIWPASQFHWNTLALPLRNPWLAAILACHIQGLPPVGVIAYAGWRVLRSSTAKIASSQRQAPVVTETPAATEH